jgi:hypothetical protein
MKHLDRRLRRGGEEIDLGITAPASSPSATLMLSAPALPIGRRQERSRKLELAARDADALDRKIGARSARIRSTAAIRDSPAGRRRR